MLLRRLSPPVHLLRAFSMVVRFGSISRAADALHLTQSAVSKQIQELEHWLGVPLFERARKRLALTPAGERYEAAVSAVLAQLEKATLELITNFDDDGGALHLASLPTFGARWLIPRLPEFQRLHPRVTLHFVPYVLGYDFHRRELDCSILFGDGHWPNAQAHYLIGREVALIAPRSEGAKTIRELADVARYPLLWHVTVPDAWQRWGEAHGIETPSRVPGPQFDQFETMIRAVIAGMGVALVPRCLVAAEIESGMVDEPLPDAGYRSEKGYWLCHPEGRAQLTPLVKFREWLLSHAHP